MTNSADAKLRRDMRDLSMALREFHSALLEKAKEDHEFLHGPVKNPYELFHLVTQDPSFQWLRPLSGLMATLDEVIDAKNTTLTQQNAEDARQALEELFSADAEAFADFRRGYQAAQHRPDVKKAEERWREALQRLSSVDA